MPQLSPRSTVATLAARIASYASRVSGRGQGAMIGGLIGLKISPRLLAELAASKKIALITGTNGKSTTTRMIATALATQAPVATQVDGANMDAGIAAALISAPPTARYAALEVDELHVPHIRAATNPEVLVLLNLSRDQLDRYGELGAVERTLRESIKNHQKYVVANCDDVYVTSAVGEVANVIWVAGGGLWRGDAVSCPRTGKPIIYNGVDWFSSGDPGFKRPEPHWWWDEHNIYGPQGFKTPLKVNLPGNINRGNATMAVATATLMGINPAQAVAAMGTIVEVAGRYRTVTIGEHEVRVLLAKNPAGWQESLAVLAENPQRSIIISVNGKIQDGQDLSWLWDVNFEELARSVRHSDYSTVVCMGERAHDAALRLEYAGITAVVADNLSKALALLPAGGVDILGNYTAFIHIKEQLATSGSL